MNEDFGLVVGYGLLLLPGVLFWAAVLVPAWTAVAAGQWVWRRVRRVRRVDQEREWGVVWDAQRQQYVRTPLTAGR
jgi:hypothetical protein